MPAAWASGGWLPLWEPNRHVRAATSSSGVSHCGRGPSCASLHLVRQGFTLAVHLEEQDLQLLRHTDVARLHRRADRLLVKLTDGERLAGLPLLVDREAAFKDVDLHWTGMIVPAAQPPSRKRSMKDRDVLPVHAVKWLVVDQGFQVRRRHVDLFVLLSGYYENADQPNCRQLEPDRGLRHF